MARDDQGHAADVMMGDLVLTEEEVNPVMSALLDNGLDVTALHNHFFWESPRMFYMHVHGMARRRMLARSEPALALIGKPGTGHRVRDRARADRADRHGAAREDPRSRGGAERRRLQDHGRPPDIELRRWAPSLTRGWA